MPWRLHQLNTDITAWMHACLQVERNTSGSRPKELFEDLIEDMEGEYERAKVGACRFL
jgi:hypothetical protein